MGLKLTVNTGDTIVFSDGYTVDIVIGRNVVVDVEAPKDVKISTIFHDPGKRYKTPPGQKLTTEDQRKLALDGMKRRNRK